MKVLLVEDNENAREALAGYLRLDGFEVVEVETLGAAEGREMDAGKPDLVVLDVMLPDGDGFLFAKRLRERSEVPVLFLTARDQESDRITGLELGADDYVVKPFSPREVVLRINAILRRTSPADPGSDELVAYELPDQRMTVDGLAHRVVVNESPVTLTRAEWNILTHLAQRSPQVFSRMQLLESCLDSIAEGSERTIDSHVKNLRRKLGSDEWIETVRGFGYRFRGERV